VAVADAIPFAQLAQGSTARLYALKGEIVARGIRAVLDLEMPVFPKRRFQHGAAAAGVLGHLCAATEASFRSRFLARYQG
jgi:asparagine synthase (glutamine-hydrolysing)